MANKPLIFPDNVLKHSFQVFPVDKFHNGMFIGVGWIPSKW